MVNRVADCSFCSLWGSNLFVHRDGAQADPCSIGQSASATADGKSSDIRELHGETKLPRILCLDEQPEMLEDIHHRDVKL